MTYLPNLTNMFVRARMEAAIAREQQRTEQLREVDKLAHRYVSAVEERVRIEQRIKSRKDDLDRATMSFWERFTRSWQEGMEKGRRDYEAGRRRRRLSQRRRLI
jgi:hypothetical protein